MYKTRNKLSIRRYRKLFVNNLTDFENLYIISIFGIGKSGNSLIRILILQEFLNLPLRT